MVSAAKIDRVETMQPPIESSDENESVIPSVTGSKQSFLLRHKKKTVALSLALVTATAIAIAVHLSVKVGPTNSNSNNSSNVSTSKIKSDPFDNTKHNFSGDISQFISTKEIFKKQSVYGNSQCDASRGLWNFELFTDDYPWETDWELLYVGRIGYFFADFGLEDSIVALGPPAGTNYERRTLYKGYLCLPVGNFVLRMKDLEGDGICCDFGEGYFTVKVNGNVVAKNDPDKDSYTVQDLPFEITSSGVDTSSPTASPTYSPTEVNEICSVFY